MCGIAGIAAADRLHPDETGRALRMRDILVHRGPDGAGLHAASRCVLAHRRLSIVDLEGGHQPLANEDETIWVTYNGEMYNHAALRAELEAKGHRYRTRSDTETIVHAYEEWGDDCVLRFRGLLASAIWYERGHRLLLVRDRLGFTPLYWALAPATADRGARLVFASEIKSLLESGLVTAQENRRALAEVLATRYTSGADTLFAGIYKLLPGHRLVYEHGTIRITQYWEVPTAADEDSSPRVSDRDLVAQFRALLEESVRLRLMADVPLGAFLSGGIDSTAVTALMARQLDRPVETFSVAFDDRAFSELDYSRQAAHAVGARLHEVVVSDEDFFAALPRMIWHEDEPIAHPSSVPLHFLSRLARQHVKVVLTGEGSDELLAGYSKYPRALVNWTMGGVYRRMMPAVMRRAIASRVVPRLRGVAGRYASRSFLAMEREPDAMFLDNFAGMPLAVQRELLEPGVSAPHLAYAASLEYFNAAPQTPLLDRLLFMDIKTYLVELLMKQDQMSMSASIESRVPFLDHHLVEFAARLPRRLKLGRLTTKRILREAMHGVIPPAILSRPKMGFPVPIARWTAGRWNGVARDILLDTRTRERGIVQAAAITRLLDDHRAGRRQAGDAIWALLNLELWQRTFIDGAGVQTLPCPARSDTARAPTTALQHA
jgi:asparagine synthase (glutamine-hydrolysing)